MNSLWTNAYEIDGILMEMEEVNDDAEKIAELEKALVSVAKGMCIDKKETIMNKSFWYGSICREDVLHVLGEEHKQKVENLTDSDMADLAKRMYDGCIENYWFEVLEDAYNTVFGGEK